MGWSDEINEAIDSGLLDVTNILDTLGLEIEGGLDSSELSLLCLTNSETKPSFFINRDTGNYNCFSCGGGGNFLKLVASILSDEGNEAADEPDYHQAYDFLLGGHDSGKLKVSAIKRIITAPDDEKKELSVRDFSNLFEENYSTDVLSNRSMVYWEDEHGIKKETLKKFRVREVIRGYYSGKCIIPIYKKVRVKKSGKVLVKNKRIAFEARSFLKESEWKKRNPWRFSSEGFNKTLYPKFWHSESNIWISGKPKNKVVAVCEDIPSAMRFHQIGMVGISCLGSQPNFAKLYKVLSAKKILLAFDRDNAGFKARCKAIDLLKEEFENVRIVKLSKKGTDPCDYKDSELEEFVKKAKKAFKTTSDLIYKIKDEV